MITGDTRLSTALDSNPGVLELIVGLNPHDFERLKNRAMRRYMAPRITLRRVAAMAGISERDLLDRIHGVTGGSGLSENETADEIVLPQSPAEPPSWIAGVQEDAIAWVDATPLDDANEDPLPPIMAAWKALRPGGTMGVLHRWEPQPLYDVWEKLGLRYWSRRIDADLWRIFVHRPGPEGE